MAFDDLEIDLERNVYRFERCLFGLILERFFMRRCKHYFGCMMISIDDCTFDNVF